MTNSPNSKDILSKPFPDSGVIKRNLACKRTIPVVTVSHQTNKTQRKSHTYGIPLRSERNIPTDSSLPSTAANLRSTATESLRDCSPAARPHTAAAGVAAPSGAGPGAAELAPVAPKPAGAASVAAAAEAASSSTAAVAGAAGTAAAAADP